MMQGACSSARRLPRVLILSAPSGAGKSSLARALAHAEPSVVFCVSHTTRAPRPGEVDGVDYHFIDQSEFKAMVGAGEFLEHAQVFDQVYGTARSSVRSQLDRGCDVILDIDWKGARQVRTALADTTSVFILPPSVDTLRSRLIERDQDSATTIKRRMRDARSELEHYREFDHIVINDDFQSALDDLRAIHRDGCVPHPPDIESLVAALLVPKHLY